MYVYGLILIIRFMVLGQVVVWVQKVGERLIIFESKDKEGNYVLHYCDHKIYSNHKKIYRK